MHLHGNVTHVLHIVWTELPVGLLLVLSGCLIGPEEEQTQLEQNASREEIVQEPAKDTSDVPSDSLATVTMETESPVPDSLAVCREEDAPDSSDVNIPDEPVAESDSLSPPENGPETSVHDLGMQDSDSGQPQDIPGKQPAAAISVPPDPSTPHEEKQPKDKGETIAADSAHAVEMTTGVPDTAGVSQGMDGKEPEAVTAMNEEKKVELKQRKKTFIPGRGRLKAEHSDMEPLPDTQDDRNVEDETVVDETVEPERGTGNQKTVNELPADSVDEVNEDSGSDVTITEDDSDADNQPDTGKELTEVGHKVQEESAGNVKYIAKEQKDKKELPQQSTKK